MMFQELWHPWLIGPETWLIGIAGMSSVAYAVLKFAKIEKKLKELSLVILGAVVLGLVLVVADVSRPWNVVPAILSSLAQGIFIAKLMQSWMTIGITAISLLLLLSIILALSQTGVKPLAKIADSRIFLILLALSGFLATAYSGFLLTNAVGIPFWSNSALPLLFILTAALASLGVLRLLDVELDRGNLVTGVETALAVLVLVGLYALLGIPISAGPSAARESALALASGTLAPAFWLLVVVVGNVVPIAINVLRLRKDSRMLRVAVAVCFLIGALALRVLVLQAGIFEELHI